jgi:hypothetical protein
MKNINTYLFIALAFVFYSCEDKIDLDLDTGESQLVIDAFINSDSTNQLIRISKSSAYFLNSQTPGVSNAKVKIEGPNGINYIFNYHSNGYYAYKPSQNGKLDSIGFNYKLYVEYEGSAYLSQSTLNPVPVIDSMTYSFEEEDGDAEEGYYSQFWARDFAGRDDFYWIKAYKDGKDIDTINYAQYNLSQNAAFGGTGADGFVFILPIRAAITNEEEPFETGQVSSIELLSINEDVWNYLIQLSVQANNDGLFATPTANIKSNFTDIAGNIQNDALGVFSMSAISRKSIKIQ